MHLILSTLLALIILWNYGNGFAGAMVKYTNLKCTTLDKAFCEFRHCQLKVPKRGVIAMRIYLNIYQGPSRDITVNLAMFKKANGYRPFLYNISADFCKFKANPKQQPFLKIFFDMFLEDSNVNHTCPYDHDIILENVVLRDEYLRLMPLPTGDYMFQLKIAINNEWKFRIDSYMEVIEKE